MNQYLSLIHESDSALEYLISYFEKVDDPVEIVFFGDHQPSLSSSFYPYLNGKGLGGLTLSELENLYTVPFFIWTNYDSDKESVELTSLNYLSTLALERAGIALPAYNQFLADMMEEIPAVNSRGFYSKSQGKFLHVEDAAGEDAKWLKNYALIVSADLSIPISCATICKTFISVSSSSSLLSPLCVSACPDKISFLFS